MVIFFQVILYVIEQVFDCQSMRVRYIPSVVSFRLLIGGKIVTFF